MQYIAHNRESLFEGQLGKGLPWAPTQIDSPTILSLPLEAQALKRGIKAKQSRLVVADNQDSRMEEYHKRVRHRSASGARKKSFPYLSLHCFISIGFFIFAENQERDLKVIIKVGYQS